MDICMEVDHAGLQWKLKERVDQSEAIKRDRQKKLDEVNAAILARAAEATKRYAELEEQFELAEKRREQAERDLALEKEASANHLSNLSLLADQLKKANADLAASQADLQSSQEELRKSRVEQAESHLESQRLAGLNEQLVTEKDRLAASLTASQNTVTDLTEANSQLRDTVADLQAKRAEQDLLISELNRSHIQYLRNWVSSSDYVGAYSYSAQTNYCVGYSDARVAIFEALNKLGMGDMLSPGDFRAYADERMLVTGQTLRRPVTKRPAVNPPGTPADDVEETEWEPPYSSPLPVAGELVDLHPDVYADLVLDYERRGYSSRDKTSGSSEIILKPLEEKDAAVAQAGKEDNSGAES